MYCKCLRERSGPSTFLQLLLHKGPLSICVQLIYLGWFQHSDIPTCWRGPGLTCAGHGDRYHSPFGAASVQPGAPGSVLRPSVGQQGSQIAPGTQNHPKLPKPPHGPSRQQPALCKGTAGAARSRAGGSPWPQPLLGTVSVPEPAQPAVGLWSRCCRSLTGGLRTPEVTSPRLHAVMGAHNNYKLPACPSSGVLSHMMSHIWDSTSWWGW